MFSWFSKKGDKDEGKNENFFECKISKTANFQKNFHQNFLFLFKFKPDI